MKKMRLKFCVSLTTRGLCAILSLTLILACFPMYVSATTSSSCYSVAGVHDERSIEVSNELIKKAKKALPTISGRYHGQGYIGNAYGVNIYHFKASSSAWYSFYTTGRTDTVIKVYEDKSVLLASFDDLGWSDDRSLADTNNKNADLIRKLKRNSDYYVCIRLKDGKIGNYTLVIEENSDKMLFSKYGYDKWTVDSGGYKTGSKTLPSVGSGTSTTAFYSYGAKTRQYLTQGEVILFYWSLDPALQEAVGYDLNYVYTVYKSSRAKAISLLNTIVSLIPMPYSFSVCSNLAFMLVEGFYSQLKVEPYEMLQKLHSLCGVKSDGKTWNCTSGLLIEEYLDSSQLNNIKFYFYADKNAVRTGGNGEKGTWSK